MGIVQSMARPWKEMAAEIKAGLDLERGSQTRLALRSGINGSTLNRYLSGERIPDIDDFVRLSRALGVPLSHLLGEAATPAPLLESFGAQLAGVPLVAKGVAAGAARVPTLDEVSSDDVYFFREDWLRVRHKWTGDADRFFCVRLAGVASQSDSMEPTIRAASILLVDRKFSRKPIRPRSIWLVSTVEGELMIKRVTQTNGSLLLESDATGPTYAAQLLPVWGPLDRVLPGKVIWWGTNASHAE